MTASSGNTTPPATAPTTSDMFMLGCGDATGNALGTNSTSQFSSTSGATTTGGNDTSTISVTDGNNSFTAGPGTTQITGGSGADTYNFNDTSGVLKIQDFSAAKGDVLNIASSLQPDMQLSTSGSGTVLMFGNNGMIDLSGVTTTPTIHWTT